MKTQNALTFSFIRYASRRVVTNVHAKRHFFINDRTWTVTPSVNGFQPFGAFAITNMARRGAVRWSCRYNAITISHGVLARAKTWPSTFRFTRIHTSLFSYILGLSYIFLAPSSSFSFFFKQHFDLNSAQTDRTVILYERSIGRRCWPKMFRVQRAAVRFFLKAICTELYKTQDKKIFVIIFVLILKT